MKLNSYSEPFADLFLLFALLFWSISVNHQLNKLESRVKTLERENEEVLRPKAIHENAPRDDNSGKLVAR